MAATQKIVINNVLHIFTSDFYQGLFKPGYNPKRLVKTDTVPNPKPVDFLTGRFTGVPNSFYLPKIENDTHYPYSLYSEYHSIHSAFLTTQSTLDLIDKLQMALYNNDGSFKERFVEYVRDDDGKIHYRNSKINTDLVTLFGKDVEGNLTGKYTKTISNVPCGLYGYIEDYRLGREFRSSSQDVLEVLLRHLYSVYPQFREMAFDAIKGILGSTVSQQEIDEAKRCFIPLVDLNTDDFEMTFVDRTTILTDSNPVKLEQQYREVVHNPKGKELFLYFPQINSARIGNWRPTVSSNYRDGGSGDYVSGSLSTYPVVKRHNEPTLSSKMMYGSNDENLTRTLMIPYTALSVTDTEGNGDIKMDYVDEIDYIDSLRIVIDDLVEYTNPV